MSYDFEEHREEMEEYARFLKTLAHPLRLCILEKLIAEKSMCVSDFCACMEASQPLVSKHLLYLKNQGVLDSKAMGTKKYYFIRYKKAEALLKLLKGENEFYE